MEPNHKMTLKADLFFWIGAMVLAAVLAFVLLVRDSHRQFGAVSFGSLPDFKGVTVEGKEFNAHAIKSGVWAVLRLEDGQKAGATVKSLLDVMRMTGSGKRYLHILSFEKEDAGIPLLAHAFYYRLRGIPSYVQVVFAQAGANPDTGVLLVDQNAVIRGVYDLSSVDDFRRFRQDVVRLL